MVLRRNYPRVSWFFSLALSVLFVAFLAVSSSEAGLTPLVISEQKEEIPAQRAWFNNFTGYRDNFAQKYGTEFAFLLNYAQQIIADSKQSQGKSRGVGYLNFEIKQRLWPGAAAFMELETDKGRGVDKFIPTFSWFNSNSGADASFYIPELYLEQDLCQDKISIDAGKLDFSDWFDASAVAGSADTQFLSDALVDNLTIPFPAKGIGAMINFKPYEWLYLESGAATAEAHSTKAGLSDGFNSLFFISELGLSPKICSLQGNYRFIFHLNHQRLERIDEEGDEVNDSGFAVSFDQAITEGITLFFRYGLADEKVRDIKYFWSFGGQITEPIPGRKLDCLGIGVARSIMGKDYREANGEDTARAETISEVYYSYSLNKAFTITPDIQIVINPGADKTAKTAVVCGLRFLLSF